MQTDCFPDSVVGWPKRPISELAFVNPRYPVLKGGTYPFVEMAAVAERFGGITSFGERRAEGSGLSRFKPGDTLFAKITPCPENEKVAYVRDLPDDVALGSTEFIVLSPKPTCNGRYLYHLVSSYAFRGRAIARMEGSTGRQRVPEEVFTRRLLVPIPPRNDQDAIAQALDGVESAIMHTRRSTVAAEALRAAVLDDLLKRGIAEGRIRSISSTDEFELTPAGLVPNSWEISTVDDEFLVQGGFTLNEDRRPRLNKRLYLRVANVHRDRLELSSVYGLEATDAEYAPRALAEGDLLVVEGHADRMAVGRCARATKDVEGMTFQNHLFRLRTKGRVLPEFGCLWLNSAYAQRYWNARCSTSSGLNTINKRTLRRLLIPVPRKDEQTAAADIAAAHRSQGEALVARERALEATRDALADDLLSGRVRLVADREVAEPL
jgi:type I restriction enzyme S subunit